MPYFAHSHRFLLYWCYFNTDYFCILSSHYEGTRVSEQGENTNIRYNTHQLEGHIFSDSIAKLKFIKYIITFIYFHSILCTRDSVGTCHYFSSSRQSVHSIMRMVLQQLYEPHSICYVFRELKNMSMIIHNLWYCGCQSPRRAIVNGITHRSKQEIGCIFVFKQQLSAPSIHNLILPSPIYLPK